MESINLTNIISPNREFDKSYINSTAHQLLIEEIMPCFTVIQIPSKKEEELYKLYPANKKQALFLAAVKKANNLCPSENPYSYVFCQIM